MTASPARVSSSSIVQLLRKYGPSLTSELAGRLRDSGLSPDAARQKMSRLPSEVHVLHGLPFPKRARFIYLEEQFSTDRYWDALIEAIGKASPAYSVALAGLRGHGGIVPTRHFEIISGAPVAQKRQLSATKILDRLCSVQLVSRTEIDGIGERASLGAEGAFGPSELAGFRARLLTEAVLPDAIRSWVGRMNLASPKVTRIRDEDPLPKFSTFRFDLCGPCYLHPLTRTDGKTCTPGFLVADVGVGQQLDERAVEPFLRKCRMLSQLRNLRPFLPMLIADGFTPEALRACRSQGIITTRPDTLFGQDTGRALGELFQTLTNAAAMAAGNPEKIESLFTKLSEIEGSAGNLRGALFELLVGHMVRSIEGGSIDIGVLVQDPGTGKRAEIDVRLVRERQLRIYECKGYQPSAVVRAGEVSKWLENRIPTINSAHRAERRFDNSTICFEFWTCGAFDDEALRLLKSARNRTRRYTIGWKDGSAVGEYAKGIAAPGIKRVLNEHYFDHPLADIPDADLKHQAPIVRNTPLNDLDLDEEDLEA